MNLGHRLKTVVFFLTIVFYSVTMFFKGTYMTTPTRFYLEQQILDCWRVTDDISTILDISEGGDIDRIQNSLIGIRELYTQRFDDMWATVDAMIKDGKIL